MSDVEAAFAEADGALVPYITAGDPDAEATKEQVRALVAGGADVVELGLPFSEPIADGSTIQEAIQRSLANGMTPGKFLDLVADLDVDAPLVCMTYYNLVYQYGDEETRANAESPVEPFVAAAAEAGISGLIIPDLPVEESAELRAACDEYGVDLVFVVAPTTEGSRLQNMLEQATGFVYVQARLGTTGARADVSDQTHESLQRIAEFDAGNSVPKAVGFGVSEREHAEEITAAGADGVVAGSVFVDIIAEHGDDAPEYLRQKARELKEGAHAGTSQSHPEPERT
ncbi:tryptophan synthase subunit alpha [Haloarculaceae archaeon H-GB1-1]|nr:tryptophan synthase subunit alpha [Haloarculaceae archaeon H-GB1-1]